MTLQRTSEPTPDTGIDARVNDALSRALRTVVKAEAPHDDDLFSDLGGDSLRAVRVLSKCWRALGVELPIEALKPATRIGDLRARLRAAVAEANSGEPGTGEPAGLVRAGTGRTVRLSPGQDELWSLYRADPANIAYNVPLTVRFGDVDPGRLRSALASVVARHGALRTTVADGPDGPMGRSGAGTELDWAVVDVSADPPEDVASRINREVRSPLDLTRSPLRARLLLEHPSAGVLVLVLHHLICDEWSLRILTTDLVQAYERETGPEAVGTGADALDVAERERAALTDYRRDELARFWASELQGTADVLELPTDRPRPPRRTFHGDRIPVSVDRDTVAGIRAVARREGVTPFTVLSAACGLMLSRYSGQDDLVLGIPVAGRDRPDLDQVIGYLVKTVPLRVRVSDAPTVHDLLTRLHDGVARVRDHADLPLEGIVEAAEVTREPGVPPLVQCALVLYSDGTAPTPPSALGVEVAELGTGTSKFDMNWYLDETNDGLDGYIEFCTDLFDADTVRRMHRHLSTLLRSIIDADPDTSVARVPMLGEGERAALLAQSGGPGSSDWEPVHRGVVRAAAARPEHPALWFAGRTTSYRELVERADRLTRVLRERGVGPESLVGVHLARSPEQIVALMATLRAGAAYLPLDPGYPTDRLAHMVRDARLSAVVTSVGDAAVLPADALDRLPTVDVDAAPDDPWAEVPDVAVEPDRLAYVIYTSGTTGRPKGVEITHRGLANVIAASRTDFGIDEHTRVLQAASFSFDASVWEIFMALSCGATLCLGPPDLARADRRIDEVIAESGADLVYLPPALLGTVDPDRVPGVRVVITGGDLVTEDLRCRWSGRCRFHVAYGPTEGTIVQTWQEHDDGLLAALPIGRPIRGVRLYVLDATLEPVPVGVVGEVHVGGLAVSRGYRGQPAATAARYLPDPYAVRPGARMYRTGDRVRRLPSGELTFVGRSDHQVKVRGYRIEPAEVEAALLELDGVRAAAVLAEPGPQGRAQLVAYVVTAPGDAGRAAELCTALGTVLPEHMVPTRCHRVPTMPLTANGKVDRAVLPRLAAVDDDSLERLLERVEKMA